MHRRGVQLQAAWGADGSDCTTPAELLYCGFTRHDFCYDFRTNVNQANLKGLLMKPASA